MPKSGLMKIAGAANTTGLAPIPAPGAKSLPPVREPGPDPRHDESHLVALHKDVKRFFVRRTNFLSRALNRCVTSTVIKLYPWRMGQLAALVSG
jgi:hypothetical protein